MKKLIKVFVFFVGVIILFSGCESREQKQARILEAARQAFLEKYVEELDPAVKISQLFLVNIEGNEKYYPVEKTGVLNGNKNEGEPLIPGGCLFFSYNVGKTQEQIKGFTKSIKDSSFPPPYIAIDQEGGYVNRLRGITDKFPSEKQIADTMTLEEASVMYEKQSSQMASLGLNMNLAPVVEVEADDNKDFLDTRSFGNLEKVLSYGQTEINVFEHNKIGTVLKHFPGNSNTDPHTGLPEIKTTKRELEERYIAPFKALLPLSSAVLMSHARVTVTDDKNLKIDSSTPACLSEYWVTEVVRRQCGFDGLILSDDIFMGALADNGFPPEVAAVKAIEAGIDVIMLSEKRFGSVANILLEKAAESPEFEHKINEAVIRVIEYKIKAGLMILASECCGEHGERSKEPHFSFIFEE